MLETELIKARDGDDRRLMIVLHGLGDSMEGYRWLPDALGLPWMHYLLVNAPDPYFGGYSWYDFAGDPDPGIRRSREMLFELLDEQRRAGHLARNIFLFGFSQGCLMCLETAMRYPQRLAGFVGISGYAHEPGRLITEMSPVARDQSFLFTHGTQDPLVPCREVHEQVKQLQAAGVRIEWKEFNKVHTIAGEEELGLIRSFVVSRAGVGVRGGA